MDFYTQKLSCIHAFSMAQFMSAFTNFESSYSNRLAKCGRDITEEENVGYPQSIEIIDKASIRNTFGILWQTPFLRRDQDDDKKNQVTLSFIFII